MEDQTPPRAKQPESLESYREKAKANGWQRYERKHPRSLAPSLKTVGAGRLSKRSLGWVLPWSISDYPGKERGAVELLGGRAALESIRQWNRGNDPMPAWAANLIADAIEQRMKSGAALVEELRSYAASRPARKVTPGFRFVDPVTGLDKRSRVGRKRTKEV